jgi:photosystem II stability/assembly factor-like uncharacterized protein
MRRMALALLLALWPAAAQAHDASSWGGVFRSTDGGASWFQANQGRLIGSALAIAVDPLDRHHLLVGTDEGLLVSQNGGLDWQPDLRAAGSGPVLALAVDPRRRQLAAGPAGLFRSDDGAAWQALPMPAGASPARGLVTGEQDGRVYLLGWRGLFRSDDWGEHWSSSLVQGEATSLVLSGTRLVCLVDNQLWMSTNGGEQWTRANGPPLHALATDAGVIWGAGNDRLFRSTDAGETWDAFGQPLPDADTEVRGIFHATDQPRIVLSTDRGVYVSSDAGATWSLATDNLPGHVEAGPLLRDPVELNTLYVGFALIPYGEQWRRAAEGGSALARLALADIVGGAALLALLALGGGMALHWLGRSRSA